MSSAPSTQICPCMKERSVLPLFSQACNRQMFFCAALPLSLSYWRVLCSASTCCRELRPGLPYVVERERVVTTYHATAVPHLIIARAQLASYYTATVMVTRPLRLAYLADEGLVQLGIDQRATGSVPPCLLD